MIITLANVDLFSKLFHRFIRVKILALHLTCNVLLHYLVKFQNQNIDTERRSNVGVVMFQCQSIVVFIVVSIVIVVCLAIG